MREPLARGRERRREYTSRDGLDNTEEREGRVGGEWRCAYVRLQRSTSCKVLTINANPFRKLKPRFRVALAAPSPQVAAHFRGLASSMLRDPCADFPRSAITLRARKTTDQNYCVLYIEPPFRVEFTCTKDSGS